MQQIKKSIQNGDYETFSIDENPYQMCRLLDGCFISCNYGSATLFDENLNVLKRILLPGSEFCCCAIHNDKGIYFTNFEKSCIYLMENQLNKIKTFGTKGSNIEQLNSPSSIFCHDEYLYVSDQKNNRIQILTSDLKYHDTIRLNFVNFDLFLQFQVKLLVFVE